MESPIDSYLRQIHAEIAQLKEGKPYSTIPAMANVDPDNFGIALATVDGQVYEVGDTREEFTIQSISKPFTYGLALEDLGPEAVDDKVDVEPSGDPFNEISLAEGTGRPANAMINAGALTATSLIKGSGGQSGFKRILSTYSAFAGRQLSVSEKVYESELKHGHRNTALAHLLRSFNIIEDDPTPVLEDYFRQCSVLVNCFDLSVMAATLANGGKNPLSGKQVLEIGSVERVLSVMMTSGMYDDAGAWISSVGMPGKSGVAGGIIAVLPGQVGLAVYSPPLDAHGSSVRGLATAQRLSRDMELHFVRAARTGRSAILAAYDVSETPSGIRRNDEAADILRGHGHRARVIELNGDLLFAGTESMVRELSSLDDDVELVVLDLRRTEQVSAVALRMLAKAREGMAVTGRELVLIEADGSVADALADPQGHAGQQVPSFGSRSDAVEYCEKRLLARYGNQLLLPDQVPVTASPALAPLEESDAQALQALMTAKKYDDGDVIRRVGLRFGGVYFITSGMVSSTSPGPTADRVKLNTLSAGMTFGELALGSGNRQESTVRAVGPVEVMVLSAEAISELEASDPRLAIALWKALTRDAYTRVEQYVRESVVRIRE
ncbi:MAG: glutaminase [Arthrobacter sp.]|nr:glutaminase [Arthrobacter sp.]MCU1547362.1 glutaminase [Arthrobacter sp.]